LLRASVGVALGHPFQSVINQASRRKEHLTACRSSVSDELRRKESLDALPHLLPGRLEVVVDLLRHVLAEPLPEFLSLGSLGHVNLQVAPTPVRRLASPRPLYLGAGPTAADVVHFPEARALGPAREENMANLLPLRLLEFLFGWTRAEKLIGQRGEAAGRYRRSPRPDFEMRRLKLENGETVRAMGFPLALIGGGG